MGGQNGNNSMNMGLQNGGLNMGNNSMNMPFGVNQMNLQNAQMGMFAQNQMMGLNMGTDPLTQAQIIIKESVWVHYFQLREPEYDGQRSRIQF